MDSHFTSLDYVEETTRDAVGVQGAEGFRVLDFFLAQHLKPHDHPGCGGC
jgi:hypothetical protein